MRVAAGDRVSVPTFLSNERVVVLDVETTGFNPAKDRVIEFGSIWIESGELVMDHSTLINPGLQLPGEIVLLTGISQKDVDRAAPFQSIAEFVIDLIEDPSVVVAYNSSFDMSFLRHEIKRAGMEVPKLGPIIDPLKWVRCEDRGKKCNLGLAAERRGIKVNGAHRALADCWMTLAVMDTLKMPDTLPKALAKQKGLYGSWKRG